MIPIIVGIIIATLAVSLLLSMAEASSGYVGDTSMIPGCLACGAMLIAAVVVVGFILGSITIQFH